MGCGPSKSDGTVADKPSPQKGAETATTDKSHEKHSRSPATIRAAAEENDKFENTDLPARAKSPKDEMVWSARRGSLIPKSVDDADVIFTKQVADVLEGTKDTFNIQ
eukprot:Opistho-2@36733